MNRIPSYLFFLILFAFSLCLYAQQNKFDSLQAIIKSSNEDTLKVKSLCELARVSDGEASLKFSEQALTLSEKIKYPHGISFSHTLLGQYYYFRENFSLSLAHCITALNLAKKNNDYPVLSQVCLYIGYNHFRYAPEVSLEFYKLSLEYCIKTKDDLQKSYVLSAIGNIYESRQDGKGALEYYQQSLEIRKKLGLMREYVSSLIETARAYDRIKDHDKSSELILLAQKTEEENGGDAQNLIYIYQMIGYDYVDDKQDNKTGLVYFLKSYELIKKNNLYDLNNIYCIKPVADIYFKMGDYKKAGEFYKLFADLFETNQQKLSNQLYEAEHTMQQAIENQKMLLKDAEIETQNIKIKEDENLRLFFIVGFATLVALTFFIYRNYLLTRKLNVILEQKVKEKTAELLTANKELEAFIYKASHDLKGPLISSASLVQLARDEKNPEEIKTYLNYIQQSLGKLDSILVSLHEVALIRQGKIVLKKIDAESLIRNLITNFKGAENFEKMDFQIKSEIKKDFVTDELLFQTILRNMIENAIKYSRRDIEKPFMKIELTESGGMNLLKISDNGIGIAKEYRSKVFEVFFRATHESKGSGLGLYIVKSAISKLGGKVEINETENNMGISFLLFFPQNLK